MPQAQAKLQQLSVMEGLYFSSTAVDATHSLSATLSAMIRVLIFAFILISSLLCYLNLYNAISGLMIARRKDFAILRSAGMTLGQIGKLCRYELWVLLLESLLLAAPVTALLCWGINTILVGRFGHFTVVFPALPLAAVGLLSLLVVFIMEKICCARGKSQRSAPGDQAGQHLTGKEAPMVLIVEDDPIIVEALTLSLTQEGCETLSAGTKARAQTLLQGPRREDITFCLLDVMLPRRQRPGPVRRNPPLERHAHSLPHRLRR